MVRQRPQSSLQSLATCGALTVMPSLSPSGCSSSIATVSRTSFSFTSMICSFVSSSSASGTLASSTSSRCSSGISWHIRNAPTKTSTWRPCALSKKSIRSFEFIALKATCGSYPADLSRSATAPRPRLVVARSRSLYSRSSACGSPLERSRTPTPPRSLSGIDCARAASRRRRPSSTTSLRISEEADGPPLGAVDALRDRLDLRLDRRVERVDVLELRALVRGSDDRLGQRRRALAALHHGLVQLRRVGAVRERDLADELQLVVRVAGEAIDGDDGVQAELAHDPEMADQVLGAGLDRLDAAVRIAAVMLE